MRKVVVGLALCFAIAPIAACGDDDTPGTPDAGEANTGTYYHFVNNDILTPENATQAQQYGMDLDGDGMPDNGLGNILQVLAQNDVDVQATIDDAVTAGSILILHSVRADDLANDATVSWQVYLGQEPATPPAYNGSDSLTIDTTGPMDAKLLGGIVGGQFTGGPQRVTIKLSLVEGSDPLNVDLVGARIQATVTATGCSNAKLAGAITESDLNTKILPEIASMMNDTIARDCAGSDPDMCTVDSTGEQIVDMFDKPTRDGNVTVEELKNNSLIGTLLAPDVDLEGNDQVDDALSLGVGMTCVNAVFTAPGE